MKTKMTSRGRLPKTTKIIRHFLEEAVAVELPISATNRVQLEQRAEAHREQDMGRYLLLNPKGEPYFPSATLGLPDIAQAAPIPADLGA